MGAPGLTPPLPATAASLCLCAGLAAAQRACGQAFQCHHCCRHAVCQHLTARHHPLLSPPQALGAINENNNIDKWIGVIVILLAVGMNMSAVDSLQVGALLSKHGRLRWDALSRD